MYPQIDLQSAHIFSQSPASLLPRSSELLGFLHQFLEGYGRPQTFTISTAQSNDILTLTGQTHWATIEHMKGPLPREGFATTLASPRQRLACPNAAEVVETHVGAFVVTVGQGNIPLPAAARAQIEDLSPDTVPASDPLDLQTLAHLLNLALTVVYGSDMCHYTNINRLIPAEDMMAMIGGDALPSAVAIDWTLTDTRNTQGSYRVACAIGSHWNLGFELFAAAPNLPLEDAHLIALSEYLFIALKDWEGVPKDGDCLAFADGFVATFSRHGSAEGAPKRVVAQIGTSKITSDAPRKPLTSRKKRGLFWLVLPVSGAVWAVTNFAL